ncbi:GNAT family N-acetyltransferase [Aeromicrobium sp.]|uniref:GNAT family N-acetyltransferase n=1 Tax=Aeromicrobium sp. TaxID=1871063 RepID=UPI0019A20673|nr:GNAT family N-acetyltransferase [Aeromicrobium sp.]MBC7631955.1 GNAT family N-acetyltransferase [Aeromicrobium sp.]
MTHSDFDSIIHLNQNALEGVGPLDTESLSLLVKMADQALVVDHGDGDIAGFVITLPPGAEYESSRYRWFEDTLVDDYVYLDRIVVSQNHRRMGVASKLYEEIEGDQPVALEVYETNDVSLAFHESRGFAEVGALTHDGKTNLMLVREPSDDSTN